MVDDFTRTPPLSSIRYYAAGVGVNNEFATHAMACIIEREAVGSAQCHGPVANDSSCEDTARSRSTFRARRCLRRKRRLDLKLAPEYVPEFRSGEWRRQ